MLAAAYWLSLPRPWCILGWLQCLQPWKHLKRKKNKRGKNPPCETPALLIHQLVLFSAFMESFLWSSFVVYFPWLPIFFQHNGVFLLFPECFPSFTWHLNLVAVLGLYWGVCQVEKPESAPPLGSIFPCCCSTSVQNGQTTKEKTHRQQLFSFHSVFKVDFSFKIKELKDENAKCFYLYKIPSSLFKPESLRESEVLVAHRQSACPS